jgi:hypothetical protein
MNAVRDRLNRRAAGFDPSERAYEHVLRKADRRRLARRVSASVTATVITCAAFTGLWAASHAPSGPAGDATISQPPTPTSHPPQATAQILPYDGLKIAGQTAANGWVVLPDPFGIWVAGPGTLTRIDPETGDVRVTAHGGWDYDFVRLAEYGEGTIFIASGTTLLKMDAISGAVIAKADLSSLGYLDSVIEYQGTTWVTASGEDRSQVLAEVDPDTGKVLQRVDGIGQGLHELAEAGGYLFVASRQYSGPALLRIDPESAEVTPVPRAPAGASIVGVGSHLWMAGGLFGLFANDGIECLDASTLHRCGDVNLPGVVQLAASGRDLWVLSDGATGSSDSSARSHGASVTLIDGANGDVLAGPLSVPGSPSSIATLNGRAWVGYYNSGTVIEIDRCDPGTCPTSPS